MEEKESRGQIKWKRWISVDNWYAYFCKLSGKLPFKIVILIDLMIKIEGIP